METGSQRRETIEQLAEEYVERYRRGERPPLSEHTERYPDHAEQIRDLFPALVMMERIAPSSESELLSGVEPFPHRGPGEYPEQIGDYRILREIGRGGMGVVYEAEQISLGRRVALKVLPRQASSDPMVLERFRREARAAARLHYTNIVPIYDVGQDGDVRYYAMQFILGQGLDLVIAELQRLRDRAGSEPKIRAPLEGQSPWPRGEHSRQGIEDPSVAEGVELGAVLRSILTGQFDPDGQYPEQVGASPSMRARAFAGDRATPTGTAKETCAAESDPAQTRAETDSAISSEITGILTGLGSSGPSGRETPPGMLPGLGSSGPSGRSKTQFPNSVTIRSVSIPSGNTTVS